MKIDVETLQDTFKIGYEAFTESREEALKVLDYYHNRQFTDNQIQILNKRGQPVETFNIIKTFTRMLIGYYSTLVNTIKVMPVGQDDIITASILNDLADYIIRDNNFTAEGDKIKLDLILTGLACAYTDVQPTGEFDEYGRPKYKVKVSHVPSTDIIMDPLSRLEDYSDARFIHRYRWLPEEAVKKLYGAGKLKKLDEYFNHIDIPEAEFDYIYNGRFQGKFKEYNNYLIVHTIITDDNGDTWSIHWCQDFILEKKKVTYKEVKSPYRICKLNTSNKTEYYGNYREVMGTQDAINQAIAKIQLMVNTQKAFVQDGAVDNIDNFTQQFNRVNAIIQVKDLQGIKVENLTNEVKDQYNIIDNALNRIQRVLCINDSFLGMAYASDSGAKVRLQQNASSAALRYLTATIENFYRLLGTDIINLVKQYYTASDVFRVTDDIDGQRWVAINQPLLLQAQRANGEIVQRPVFEEVTDPATGEPLLDENGAFIMAPIPTRETEIAFTNADVEVVSVSYNDDDEKANELFQQFIAGPVGQMLSQVNPAGYFKIASMSIKNLKSKYSIEIAQILEDTAMGMDPAMQQRMQMGMLGGQGGNGLPNMSTELPQLGAQ